MKSPQRRIKRSLPQFAEQPRQSIEALDPHARAAYAIMRTSAGMTVEQIVERWQIEGWSNASQQSKIAAANMALKSLSRARYARRIGDEWSVV